MADQPWAIGIAVFPQAAFGTPHAATVSLSGTVSEAEGGLLGAAGFGTGDSGITVPTFTISETPLADVTGSFTRQAGGLGTLLPEGLEIAFQWKGNGDTTSGTPASDEAKPKAGVDAILQSAGLAGATGSGGTPEPDYDYTPSATPIYLTIKLWVAGNSFAFQDCILESLSIPFVGGEGSVAVARISIGSVNTQSVVSPLPTFSYGAQATLAPPASKSVAFTWGALRGYGAFTAEIVNAIEQFEDGNQASGFRIGVSGRSINGSGNLWMTADGTTEEYEYEALIAATAPTDDMTWTLGTPASGSEVLNAIEMNLNNFRATSVSYDRAGSNTQAIVEGYCTGTTAGSELTIRFE